MMFSDNSVSELLNVSVISSALGRIKSENYETRGQLNIILISSFGSGKSTILKKIEKSGLGFMVHEYTPPSIMGTVKSGGQVVKSVIVNSAGRVFLIDEFQKFNRKCRDALLSFMEDQQFRRTLGFKVEPEYYEEGKNYLVMAKDTWLLHRVKCSYITGSMYLKLKNTDDLALASRGIIVNLVLQRKDAYSLFLGKSVFKINNRIVKYHKEVDGLNMTVDNKTKEYLLRKFREVDNGKLNTGFITRILWDNIRIAAVYAGIEGNQEITKEYIDMSSVYLPIQILGLTTSTMTNNELKIVEAVSVLETEKEIVTVDDIKKYTGISDSELRKNLESLVTKGALKRYRFSKSYVYSVRYLE